MLVTLQIVKQLDLSGTQWVSNFNDISQILQNPTRFLHSKYGLGCYYLDIILQHIPFCLFSKLSQTYNTYLSLFSELNLQHIPFSLFFSKTNNDWGLIFREEHLPTARLPLIFGKNCTSSFCRSMCSNNRTNTFSRYSIPDAQRTIFRSSHIQAPSTRVTHLAPTSVNWATE